MNEIIKNYAQGYATLLEVVKDLGERELAFKPSENEWSIREIICHIADAEIVGIQRMKKVISEDNPLLTSYDQYAFAKALDYINQDEKISLLLLKTLRESFVPVLENLSESEWKRTGIHQEIGKVILEDMVKVYTDHVINHIGQIRRILNKLN